MKKTIFLILTIITLVSCKQTNNNENTNYSKLSKFYKDTTFVEMIIYPDTAYNDLLYFFKGNEIDSNTFSLLSDKVTNSLPWTEGFYGNYSFKINNQYIGLITRTPGEYSSTMISLWIYDIKNDSITNNIKLADVFGDAGAFETMNSYLFFDESNQLKAFTYSYFSYDHSVDEESDTTIEVSHNYFLTRIGFSSVDTISTDSIKLTEQFKSQIKKMACY